MGKGVNAGKSIFKAFPSYRAKPTDEVFYRREIRKTKPFALRVSTSLKMTAEVALAK